MFHDYCVAMITHGDMISYAAAGLSMAEGLRASVFLSPGYCAQVTVVWRCPMVSTVVVRAKEGRRGAIFGTSESRRELSGCFGHSSRVHKPWRSPYWP